MKKHLKVYTFDSKGVNQGVNQGKEVYTLEKTRNSKGFSKKEVWLTVEEGVNLLKISKQGLHKNRRKGKYITKIIQGNGGKQYLFLLSSLPDTAQAKYWKKHLGAEKENPAEAPVISSTEEAELNMLVYSRLKNWERKTVDKYILLFDFIGAAKGKEMKLKVEAWNEKYPADAVKISTVYQKKKAYEEYGITALIPKYGKRAGQTKIEKEWMEKYEALYLTEGKPSVYSCWLQVLGFARKLTPETDVQSFPSPSTFDYQLKKSYPASAIYLARHGEHKWNRKYGNFIERDSSETKPGECYVSDHAQIDVAVQLPNGKVCYPWLTAWSDFKSQKFVGWLLHPEAPNSDHIFQSYYNSCKEHGVPTDVYLDNGKDYRCKDFAGGREYYVKVEVDENKAKPALLKMGVTPHFAIPYNAQSKNIERLFLKVKEWFSKHAAGYRGGHIKERPEKLEKEIKNGSIFNWDDYVRIFDDFIVNIHNEATSKGKDLKGMSPNELWEKERIAPRMMSTDALKLFCMRSSKVVTIGRNGVRDSELDCYYWEEWMAGYKGEKVFFKRDIKAYQEAWIFKAGDEEFLGKASIAGKVPALVRTDIDKKQLKEAMANKKRAKKLEKSYFDSKQEVPGEDKIAYMKLGVQAINEARGYKPEASDEKSKIIRLVTTPMDEVVRKSKTKEQEREEVDKLFMSASQPRKKKEEVKLYWHEVLDDDEWYRKMGIAK